MDTYRIIILLIGRSDIWESDKRFFQGVEDVVKAIDSQNDKCIIVLGAMLPGLRDSRPMINTFTFRNDKLAARCIGNVRLEHARPGRHLIGPKGPIPEYYDGFGNINELRGDVIARALERKIYSAKLFNKYEELTLTD